MIFIKIIERKANPELVNKISSEYGISKDIVRFLLGRNVPEDIIPMLLTKEELELLPNDSITNVDKAAELINKFITNDNARIYIYGDYDSDGVNATFIMYNSLVELAEAIGSQVHIEYYLPNREEGYGLSFEWCKKLVANTTSPENTLVITVDNGITKAEETDYLGFHGITSLVTDHHKPQDILLPQCIIVDAHLNDTDDTNACGLCGAAVAYKVVAYLYDKLHNLDFEYVKKYVAHVGIATITDVMPFTQENIIFVANTLKYLNDFPYADFEYSPVTESMYYFAELNKGNKIKAKDIAFGLGPQLNSCGRMGDIQVAMDFIMSDCEEDLFENYKKIDEMNNLRKTKTAEVTSSINPPALTDLALVTRLKNCEGIAGSTASKLCDAYAMPTIVFNESDDMITGSARAPQGFDLISLFSNTECVESFGGHANAAGINIKKENFDQFVTEFNKAVSKVQQAPVVTLDDTVYVDEIIESKDLNKWKISQYDDVLYFNDFTRPVYGLEKVYITGYHTSKSNPNNICFHIKNKTKEVKVWCWGYTDTYKAMGEPKCVNLVGALEMFKNMMVIDIHNMEAA